jgi:hypothetical protein
VCALEPPPRFDAARTLDGGAPSIAGGCVKTRLGWLALTAALALLPAVPAHAQESHAADSSGTTAADAAPADIAGRLDALTEQLQTLQTDTDKLKRFKFSGYLQVRWEHAEDQSDTVKVSGNPYAVTVANRERIFIRRGRFKLTYDASPLSQAVLYFDGGQDRTLRLLEGYLTLLDPWTPTHAHGLTVGQMNVPFGYEIERSSSVRELPERSRAENVLFNGERDRGVKLVSAWTPKLETVLGVFNGGGINSTDFPATDPTRNKDVLGRVRFAQGSVDGAVSYYSGHHTTPLTGPDVETDKTRLGVDAQAYYQVPMLGGGSLKGEFYSGKEINPDSVKALVVAPTTANPVRLLKPGADPQHLASDFTGWYLMWVQNLGEKFQFAARYDVYDPNTDLEHDQFARASLGLNWFFDGYTRVSVSYDVQRTDIAVAGGTFDDPADNLWTVQFQHKF